MRIRCPPMQRNRIPSADAAATSSDAPMPIDSGLAEKNTYGGGGMAPIQSGRGKELTNIFAVARKGRQVRRWRRRWQFSGWRRLSREAGRSEGLRGYALRLARLVATGSTSNPAAASPPARRWALLLSTRKRLSGERVGAHSSSSSSSDAGSSSSDAGSSAGSNAHEACGESSWV